MRRRKIAIVPFILMVMLILTLICSIIYSFSTPHKKHSTLKMAQIEDIQYDKITDKNGKYYYNDQNYKSSFGIDVSEFLEHIDWEKVKKDDVEFAYMRIGRRGASTGLLYIDDSFEEYYEGATKAGLDVGVYFFSQAINTSEAREEARFVINLLKTRPVDLPVVYDLEQVFLEEGTVRTDNLTKEIYTENALAFCDELEKNGYQAMIYTYPYWAENLYDMEKLAKYPVWLAVYDADIPKHDYPIAIWQYSKEGKIDGINYDVDYNIMFIKK